MMSTKTTYYNLLDLTLGELCVIQDALEYNKYNVTSIQSKANISEVLEQIREILR